MLVALFCKKTQQQHVSFQWYSEKYGDNPTAAGRLEQFYQPIVYMNKKVWHENITVTLPVNK